MKKIIALLLTLALVMSFAGCVTQADPNQSSNPSTSVNSTPSTGATTQPTTAPTVTEPAVTEPTPTEPEDKLDPEGFYYSKEDVALFIHQYGKLPKNFITKNQAKSQFGGNREAMNHGYRIGGDTFKNREGLLPKKTGRTYTECDIVRQGLLDRGAFRIVFSNDGLVYYTDDHYRSFTLLYGEP